MERKMSNNESLKEETEKYFKKENETDHLIVETNKRREVLSPSGRYKLVINYYKTKKGCWNYSRGTVYRILDDAEICDIKRNYSYFHHSFVTKNKQEYLITGRSYMSQTIINLDTGEEFEPQGDHYDGMAFCWAKAYLSPDGNTLLVDGCHWACPYEYKFFDFTDPSQGWPELEIEGDDYIDADDKDPIFHDDGSITCYQTSEFFLPLNKFDDEIELEELDQFKNGEYDDPSNYQQVENVILTLKRKGNKIVVVDRWISDHEKQRIEKRRIANEEYQKWLKDFKSNDPLYLEYQKLLKEYELPAEKYEAQGITYSGWAPNFDKKETRWHRRIVQDCKVEKKRLLGNPVEERYTVDLDWAVKTGPIKLTIYKNGKTHDTVFFDEHSPKSMKQAFDYTVVLIKGRKLDK